ncbi:Uncharacterised protein [Mycobacteroides abscessus subsp. abscessus]|nr:Uncharacterised protein [Mycobacteroides abscessus subsp. abscessus]
MVAEGSIPGPAGGTVHVCDNGGFGGEGCLSRERVMADQHRVDVVAKRQLPQGAGYQGEQWCV